jgi:glyoxylase-like metal-dependent hydrolase (beta-lactamase superfamily II)
LGNTVFEGRNNVYVLEGEPTTLIDTGIMVPDVEAELREGLAEFGLAFADIEQILLTHWHYDHSGLAGTIQAESDATVRVHTADAPLVSGDQPSIHAANERRNQLFDQWGMPQAKRDELQEYLDKGTVLSGEPSAVTPFEDGDVIRAGGRDLEAVHLPGHAAGLCGFAFAGERGEEVFSGDAVLPKYTPNVGGADVRVDHPLATYADSLVRFAEREFARAWPGHRDRIDDPTGRALEILEHHRERTRKVVDVLDDHGPADAWTVSAHLFGDLSEIHILHGPGEAYAHLEHLDTAGVVDCDGNDYRLVESDPDVDALFPRADVQEQKPQT